MSALALAHRVRPSAWIAGVVGALRRQPVAAWPVAATATTLYMAYSTAQWNRLESPSWDLGIFTQLAKAYAGFDAPIVPIKGEGFNLLGDHFHPILILLGPVYALFPTAFALLALQNLLFGLSVFVLTATAIRLIGRWSGVAVGLAYSVSWGLQPAVYAQFHEIAFAVPLLALSASFLLLRRLVPAVVFAGLLVFVKEDLGLTVIALGLIIAWRLRHPAGLWLAAWGLSWLLLSVRVLLPALNSSGTYDYAERIDVAGMLADPATAVVQLFTGEPKYETVRLLLAAGGLLFLRSPLALAMVPTLLWRFASSEEGYWGPEWHYSAVLMPLLFLALVDAVAASAASRRRWVRALGRGAVPVAVLSALLILPGQPLAQLAAAQTYQQSPRWDAAHRMMDLIPEGSSVESGVSLMPYLVPRTTVYWLGSAHPTPDYLIVDAEDWSWGPVRPASAVDHAESTYPGASYTLVFEQDGYQLVRRDR